MNRIKEVRMKKNLSLRELSKLTGISYSYLWQLETGIANNPREPTKLVICRGLKISVNELFFKD